MMKASSPIKSSAGCGMNYEDTYGGEENVYSSINLHKSINNRVDQILHGDKRFFMPSTKFMLISSLQ
jgi:hypothetical protein